MGTTGGLQECLTGHSEAALEVCSEFLSSQLVTLRLNREQRCVLVFSWLPFSPPFYLALGPYTWDGVSTFWGVSSFQLTPWKHPPTDSKPSDLDNEDQPSRQDMMAEMRTDSRVRPVKGAPSRDLRKTFISTEVLKARNSPAGLGLCPSRGSYYHQAEDRRGWAA